MISGPSFKAIAARPSRMHAELPGTFPPIWVPTEIASMICVIFCLLHPCHSLFSLHGSASTAVSSGFRFAVAASAKRCFSAPHFLVCTPSPQVPTFSKQLFSMCTDEVMQKVENVKSKPEHVVLFGIEAHVCVTQVGVRTELLMDMPLESGRCLPFSYDFTCDHLFEPTSTGPATFLPIAITSATLRM